jgi:hypothetical protein
MNHSTRGVVGWADMDVSEWMAPHAMTRGGPVVVLGIGMRISS